MILLSSTAANLMVYPDALVDAFEENVYINQLCKLLFSAWHGESSRGHHMWNGIKLLPFLYNIDNVAKCALDSAMPWDEHFIGSNIKSYYAEYGMNVRLMYKVISNLFIIL